MKNLSHSKYKNTGILFECLVKQITVDTMENKPSVATSILKKYFSPSTELGKELQLYRSFFEMGKLTETKAVKFVDFISEQRTRLNESKLANEKYDLIKEIKKNYDLKSFLQIKIPSYKICASIYKTFLSESKNFDITNIQEVASARFTLIEHLIKTDKKKEKMTDSVNEAKIVEILKNETEDLRLLTYKLMLDKFNEKYDNLNFKQKQLLREYINSLSNSILFGNYVKSEIVPLKLELASLTKLESNKVLKIKLNEVISQLEKISDSDRKIKDSDLTALMIAYQLVEELK